jgi:hypothetical protein
MPPVLIKQLMPNQQFRGLIDGNQVRIGTQGCVFAIQICVSGRLTGAM